MKNKNLFYSVAAALLLTAGLSSCSSDDEVTTPVVENNNHIVKLTATLGAKSSDATRALDADGKTTTWAVGEKIAVYYLKSDNTYATGTATVTAVDGSGTATIAASLSNPQSGSVKLVYPASLANAEGGIDKSKLLANQKGTTADISTNWDAATNSGVTMTVSGSTASLPDGVKVTNQLCIVKYTLQDSGGNSINTKLLRITVGSDIYIVTPSSATDELYVAMLPVDGADVKFMAIVGSIFYSKDYSGVTLVQGKFYSNSTVKLAKVDVEAIDLGLSVKWANMNIGSESVVDYGDYYSWGETETKDNYSWATYKYCNGTTDANPQLTKYCNDSDWGYEGFTDGLTKLVTTDDAAIQTWGNSWRMPTAAEFEELLDNSKITRQWTTNYSGTGVRGMVFTSKVSGYEGNSIFMPAAGWRTGTSMPNRGTTGFYWPSSLGEEGPRFGAGFSIDSRNAEVGNHYRMEGFSVRAVQDK